MAKKKAHKGGVKVTVSDVKLDLRGLKKLDKLLQSIPSVDVGYLNNDRHPTWDFSFAELAVINEFGVPGFDKAWKIPPRPMLANTFINNKFFAKNLYTALYASIPSLNLNHVKRQMTALGRGAAQQLNKTVQAGQFMPNSEITIAAKGSAVPLTWTGALGKAGKFRLTRE